MLVNSVLLTWENFFEEIQLMDWTNVRDEMTQYLSACHKRDKLFNSVLPIGGKVESDQKNNVTSECFFYTVKW